MSIRRLCTQVGARFFASAQPERVSLLKGSGSSEPMIAVIHDLNDRDKALLTSGLNKEGYLCTDYTGDRSKLVVGLDQRLFIKKISRVIDTILPIEENSVRPKTP